MTRRAADPPRIRQDLAAASAGVLWCHTQVYAPLDDLLARVEAADHPQVRRVTVTPSRRDRPTTLATDVARAFGVVPGTCGQARGDVEMHQLVPLMLHRPVEHLLLGSAGWTHPQSLADLTVAARAAGVAVWLLTADPLTPAGKERLHALSTPVAEQDVLAAFCDITAGPAHTGEPHDTTWASVASVPASDFVTFLADTRAQLPHEDATLVEATLREEHADAARWFTTRPDPSTAAIAAALQQRWNDCLSWPQFVTVVRAWKVAAFGSGRLLKVSLDQLAGTAAAVPSAAQRNAEQWDRLWAWHEPGRAAACALVAAGLGSEDATEVTVGGTSPDGAAVTHPDGTVTAIEAPARPFLAAARIERLLTGAGDQDRLLVTPSGRLPDPRWVTTQATAARRTFGLPLASAGSTGRRLTGDRWATRWGLTLMDLT